MTDDFHILQEAYKRVATNGPTTTSYGAEQSKYSYGANHAFNAGGAVNSFQLGMLPNAPVAISDEEDDVSGTIEKAEVIGLINNLLEEETSQQVKFVLANLKKSILS